MSTLPRPGGEVTPDCSHCNPHVSVVRENNSFYFPHHGHYLEGTSQIMRPRGGLGKKMPWNRCVRTKTLEGFRCTLLKDWHVLLS